jgi:hypothetical protein
MTTDHQDLSELIQTCLDGQATDEQIDLLNSRLIADASARDLYLQMADTRSFLAVDESLWMDDMADVRVSRFSVPPGRERWLNWRPLAAAAAGLLFGMFCTSVVFAYTQPRSTVTVTKLLPLADADFESGAQIPARGIPARAGVWSGDFSRVVATENGIKPKQGERMLRVLRSDSELSPPSERSYVGEAAQVIDLRPLRTELSGADQLVEVSAQFNAIPTAPGAKYEFNVKAAAFRGDIVDAPSLWEDHEASVSRADHSIFADSDAATWQRVALPLVVPADADFLVIECAVVLKAPQAERGAVEFPGHYVDHVEVRLTEANHKN